jgi:hypothetical protein
VPADEKGIGKSRIVVTSQRFLLWVPEIAFKGRKKEDEPWKS